MRWSKHTTALGLGALLGAGTGGVLWAGSAGGAFTPSFEASASTTSHPLTQLRLFRAVMEHVRSAYVDGSRVDPDAMFTSALAGVSRLVPETLFQRDDDRLHVHIGDHRTTLALGSIDDLDDLSRHLRRIADLLVQHLDPDDVPTDGSHSDPLARIELALVNGALDVLDPHTILLSPAESKEMDVENRGEFGGVGVVISIRDGYLFVEDVTPGGPAGRAGVRPGDRVHRIDGELTLNMTMRDAQERLRGLPGSPVRLDLVRDGASAPVEARISREVIKLHPVEGRMLSGGVAWARIPTFHASAHQDLRDVLEGLARDHGTLKGLVLDLRGNPGGLLHQAVAVADAFLDDGEIVSTRTRRRTSSSREIARAPGTEDPYPLVVLVDAHSASASEIVAGALRNQQRAVVLGRRTFGKGSVQNLQAMPFDAKLKLTVAEYLTPGERSIQSVGIPADIELQTLRVGLRGESAGGSATDPQPAVSLFGARLDRREVDLASHLEFDAIAEDDALWAVPMVRGWDDLASWSTPEPEEDPEVQLAVELIQSVKTPRRDAMLAALMPLIERWRARGENALRSELGRLGVDWRDGPGLADASGLQITLQGTDALKAGERHTLRVAVTNLGSAPVFRLAASISDDAAHPLFRGAELAFGHLPPGATRSWPIEVEVPRQWPDAHVQLPLSLEDARGALGTHRLRLDVTGTPPPRLAWSWQVRTDSGEPPAVGDTLQVHLRVDNEGTGPAWDAAARLRNQSGRALDLVVGTLPLGDRVGADGGDCEVLAPGWEAGRLVGAASSDHPRVQAGLEPVYADGCTWRLGPGSRYEGSFSVRLKDALASGYELELALDDGLTRQTDAVHFMLGEAPPAAPLRSPPKLVLTQDVPTRVSRPELRISGRVTDDLAVDHVVVYHGDDKVVFQGTRASATALTVIPFTAPIALSPGRNALRVVARDRSGYRHELRHEVWLDDAELRAEVAAPRP